MTTLSKAMFPVAVALLLVACGEQANVQATQNAVIPSAADMPAASSGGRGTGTVTAIDNGAGTVTLDHTPIPEVSWPAMTMAFEAKPDLLQKIAVGDKVSFEMTMSGGKPKLVSIRSQ